MTSPAALMSAGMGIAGGSVGSAGRAINILGIMAPLALPKKGGRSSFDGTYQWGHITMQETNGSLLLSVVIQ